MLNRSDKTLWNRCPGSPGGPIGFNPLANEPPDERPLVASGVVDAFKAIWGDSWGPRMAYILHNGTAALLDCENSSLLGVNRMLMDPDCRRWVVKQVSRKGSRKTKINPPAHSRCTHFIAPV